mmetsp:Transcript_36729/g.122997  ORF Transcript_36729/g.122997 Transcript_36729/m.122997 type:complete len:205 (+) Transcript_36729:268-882(+)
MSHSMFARDSLMTRSAGAAGAAAVSFASGAGRLLLIWPVQEAGRLRLPAPPPRIPSLLAAPPPDSWSLSEGLPSASESAPNESPPRSYRSSAASSREQRSLMRLSASIMAFRACASVEGLGCEGAEATRPCVGAGVPREPPRLGRTRRRRAGRGPVQPRPPAGAPPRRRPPLPPAVRSRVGPNAPPSPALSRRVTLPQAAGSPG